MRDPLTSISTQTAITLTEEAGGLENDIASITLQLIRAKPEQAGLNVEEHMDISDGYFALSSQLADIMRGSNQVHSGNQAPNR